MGPANLASAFLVLELGALVIYDGSKNFLMHVWRGGSSQEWGDLAILLNLH